MPDIKPPPCKRITLTTFKCPTSCLAKSLAPTFALYVTAANLPPMNTILKASGAIGVATGAAVFAAPPLLGFSSAGIVTGSIAAVVQSAVYGPAVPAGSVFAILQSVGATGTIVPAAVSSVGATCIAGIVGAALRGYLGI
ncbi:Interferon-induced 6-16 family protein [Ceratobasidium theobromae]|uniref:Interferon-induced 6-16 family protein n=1 Tax=Ceratobasidium theobromae TaxID=1582974 RepID=A0A5N5QPQ6_9AGAM|nr:Interferon-induced 6-16 family protein [Ceratobasidium theobromae]